MGLDMYLHARKYVSGWEHRPEPEYDKLVEIFGVTPDEGSPHINVSFCVAYWRKANMIHRWFVDNVQDGTDDCKEYYVPPERLTELRDLCKEVLAGGVSKARELMPAASGVFFGGTEYDEWYWQDLRDTVKMLDAALDNEVLGHCDFYYRSSW